LLLLARPRPDPPTHAGAEARVWREKKTHAGAHTYRGGGIAVVADHDELVVVVRARHHPLVRRHLCFLPGSHLHQRATTETDRPLDPGSGGGGHHHHAQIPPSPA
jgi:hypothetical protein